LPISITHQECACPSVLRASSIRPTASLLAAACRSLWGCSGSFSLDAKIVPLDQAATSLRVSVITHIHKHTQPTQGNSALALTYKLGNGECRFTSEVERDPVHSALYGRQREQSRLYSPDSILAHDRVPKLMGLLGIFLARRENRATRPSSHEFASVCNRAHTQTHADHAGAIRRSHFHMNWTTVSAA
jgi:hypothetical protein